VAIPAAGEEAGRAFYRGVVGFMETDKPPALVARGGVWFRLDDIELHLGVQADFTPAEKAHPGFEWDDLEDLARRLRAAGCTVDWDDRFEGRRRFYTADPFGNRLEFIAPPDQDDAAGDRLDS